MLLLVAAGPRSTRKIGRKGLVLLEERRRRPARSLFRRVGARGCARRRAADSQALRGEMHAEIFTYTCLLTHSLIHTLMHIHQMQKLSRRVSATSQGPDAGDIHPGLHRMCLDQGAQPVEVDDRVKNIFLAIIC